MYKMIITTYENKQQELVEETNGLRDSLRDLQAELQQVFSLPPLSSPPSIQSKSNICFLLVFLFFFVFFFSFLFFLFFQLLNEHQPNKRVHSDAATTPTKPPSHYLTPSPPSTPLTSSGNPNEELLSGQFDLPYSLGMPLLCFLFSFLFLSSFCDFSCIIYIYILHFQFIYFYIFRYFFNISYSVRETVEERIRAQMQRYR